MKWKKPTDTLDIGRKVQIGLHCRSQACYNTVSRAAPGEKGKTTMTILLGLVLVLGLIFALVMLHDARSLWSGFTFLLFVGGAALAMLLAASRYAGWLEQHPAFIVLGCLLFFAALIFIVVFPALLVLIYFVEGIRILRREGVRSTNMLSLLFAAALAVYLVVWPRIGGLTVGAVGTLIYTIVGMAVFYLLFLMAMYAVSALLNLVHIRKRRSLDYIVVLGCAVFGQKVPPLLAGRLDKAIQLMACNPNAKLICSGGQGPGEDIPEGEAMAAYAAAHGVPEEKIIIENKSRSTQENLQFSRALMQGTAPRIAIVTTAYHVFRALLLARQCGIRCVGFGAKTKWYFTLNAIIREFVGYLSLSRKLHARVIGTAAGIIVLVNVICWVCGLVTAF